MAEKYFKAKIPFSDQNGIYNVSDKEPHKADAARVMAWVNAGIAEEVEDYEEPVKDPKHGEDPAEVTEIPTEPEELEPEKETEGENTQKEEETAQEPEKVEEEGDKYDRMSYPELKKAGKAAGIESYHTMKKETLKAALRKGG